MKPAAVFYLEVHVFSVESYVNSESRSIVVWGEQWLLVRFVPHYKAQGIGTLMREDMEVRNSIHILMSQEQEG